MSVDQMTPRRGGLPVTCARAWAPDATRVRTGASAVITSSPGTALPEPRRVLTS